MSAIHRRTATSEVWLNPSEGQTDAEVQADLDRSEELIDRLRERGVAEWSAKYRRIGAFKVGATKEVGPPPWPWPKAYGKFRRSPFTLSAGIGWRLTAYTIHVLRGSGNGSSPQHPTT